MSGDMKIDDRGMREMFKALQRKTGASYRDVVRGISAEVLTAAARRTRQQGAKKANAATEKLLHKPLAVKGGMLIGRTRDAKVWFSGAGWGREKWILLESTGNVHGNLKKPGAVVPGGTRGRVSAKGARLSAKNRQEAQYAVAEANRIRRNSVARIKRTRGTSKAVWLEIMRKLAMKPTNTSGLSVAMKTELHPSAKAAASGTQKGDREKYEITIHNTSQASLSRRGGDGINAFRWAMRGKVKEFRTAASKDLETYAKRFAQRHGFDVR